MELEFQSRTCKYLSPLIRRVNTTELTQEVRLSDAMPDIGRILASWGQIILRSKEWQPDQLTVSGGVMVWTLYSPEDGTQVRCVDSWIPFQLRWELEEGERDGVIRVSPLLRFADCRSLGARKMMVRLGIAAMGEALQEATVQLYEPAEVPEDVQLLQETYPVRLAKEAGEKTFQVDEELPVPEDAAGLERILAYTVAPQLQEKRMAGDKLILRGSGQLHVIYRCGEGNVHATDLEVPISAYVQLQETYGTDAQAQVELCTTSLELDQTEQQLRVKWGVVAQYLISDRELLPVTSDAYSTQRYIKMRQEEAMLPSMLEQRMEPVSVRQSLPGVEGTIVDAVFWPDYPRQRRIDDQLSFELPGQYQVLYYTGDGSLQSSAGRWEGKFQLEADERSRVELMPQPGVKTQAAGDLLSAQYKMQLQTTLECALEMIAGLQLGEIREKDPSAPALILCRTDGESLWELAKRCGSRVCDIQQANGLTGEPDRQKFLLVPVSK